MQLCVHRQPASRLVNASLHKKYSANASTFFMSVESRLHTQLNTFAREYLSFPWGFVLSKIKFQESGVQVTVNRVITQNTSAHTSAQVIARKGSYLRKKAGQRSTVEVLRANARPPVSRVPPLAAESKRGNAIMLCSPHV